MLTPCGRNLRSMVVTNIYERSKWTGKEKEVDTSLTTEKL